MNFTISVPVKPYVKQFLVNNCGNPVDLSKLPDLKLFLRKTLKKPDTRWNHKYKNDFKLHSEIADIIISEDEFYRYGWELTKTDIVAFGKEVERKAKCVMRVSVGIWVSLGVPINKSIYYFQNKFDFNEDTWSYQAIKKDFYRNGTRDMIDFDNEISKKIDDLILENLYNLGTISRDLIKKVA